jgi:hypothetical protein
MYRMRRAHTGSPSFVRGLYVCRLPGTPGKESVIANTNYGIILVNQIYGAKNLRFGGPDHARFYSYGLLEDSDEFAWRYWGMPFPLPELRQHKFENAEAAYLAARMMYPEGYNSFIHEAGRMAAQMRSRYPHSTIEEVRYVLPHAVETQQNLRLLIHTTYPLGGWADQTSSPDSPGTRKPTA